jgi:transcriptional regulator with XRE-family HTH domain
MDLTMKTLSKNIRMRRKSLGMTQKDLASNAGLTEITINRIETGKQPPRSSNLKSIADALGTTIEDLQTPRIRPRTTNQEPTNVAFISQAAAFLARLSEISPERRRLIFALAYSDPSYLEDDHALVQLFESLSQSSRKSP